MKSAAVTILLSVVVLVAGTRTVLGHHSNALVDKDTLYTVAGDVTKFAFVNPHVAIYWKGQDKQGKVIEWYASAAGPRAYIALGWTGPKMFKPGERILVQGHPMRDGTPLMQFQAIYRCSNGEAIPTDAGNEDEYRTRVAMYKLSVEKVKALCSDGKLVVGVVKG